MKASKIEWTRSTFNPWWGCERVSPGCAHCYAEAFAKRTGHDIWGGSADRRLFGDKHWNEPLRWNAEAAKTGEPWRVFCASMADVFEDRPDLVAPRARVFDLIARTPALTWLLLTKRPENMVRMTPPEWAAGWPKHVWAGTTVEDAARKVRIDALRLVPAAVRWLSLEPLIEDLGTVDFAGIAWAIIGGESGGGARPFHWRWGRSLLAQMRGQGVAPHVKQSGVRPVAFDLMDLSYDASRAWDSEHAGEPFPRDGVIVRPLDGKGADMAEWPEDLRVREYPKGPESRQNVEP